MSRSWNSWLARWKAAISPTRRSQRRKSGRIRLGLDSLETRVTPAVTYGQLLGQHAIVVADRIAPTIKLDFVLDPSGKNQTITGRVSDNFPISGTTLYMRQDNGTPRTLALGASGQFQFTTTYAVNGTADGAKTFTFVAIDKAGNVSAFARTSFTLNTTNGGALTLKLDPASDDGTQGDNKTTKATVTLTGTGPKSSTITLTLPGGTTTTAQSDVNGLYSFTNVALTSGPNAFKVTATSSTSQALSANLTVIRDNAPTVAAPISNFAVSTGTHTSVFNLPTVFSDQDINTLLEFKTNQGTFDVELFNQQVPNLVANYLKYVLGTDASHQTYANTIFHRVTNITATSTIAVLQGGGFVLGTSPTTTITKFAADAAVGQQGSLTNALGTLGMARTSDATSATSQFYFNTANNPGLDPDGVKDNPNNPNSGDGFNVFGVVRANGMTVVNASAAIPPVNETFPANPTASNPPDPSRAAFGELPITGATPNDPNFPGDTTASQYQLIDSVSVLRQPNTAAPDSLTFSAASANTSLVTAAVVNGKLVLTYVAGHTGSSLITLTATDSAGISVQSTFTVAVGDNAPPSVVITAPTTDVSVNTNPTITGIASDDTGVTKLVASVDTGPAQTVIVASNGTFSFTPNLPTNGSADGQHHVVFTATDAAGNNSTPATATFHLDATPPVVAITAPTSGQTFGANPTITGTATDNQTITGLTVSVDNNTPQSVPVGAQGQFSFTTSLATNGSADGTHTVTFIATDAAGNTSNHETLTFTLNSSHPSVTLTAPTAGQSFKTNPAFTGSVTDLSEANGLTASVDGAAAQPVTVDAQGNFTFTPTVTTDGTHNVVFSASGHADVSRSYVLDTTAPAITINSPANGQLFNFDPTIKGTIVDATSGLTTATASVDGGTPFILNLDAQGNFSFIPPVASGGVADGPHTVVFSATDMVGNISTPVTVTFTLDTVAPAVTITSPGDGVAVPTSPTFVGTATDANGVASLTVTVDGGAAQTVTVDAQGNFTFNPGLATNGSADGAHQFTFTATDTAGNVSHNSLTVYLDTTKPVATVTSPASGQTFAGNVTINGTATDNIGSGFVEVFVDGVEVAGLVPTNGTFSYTTTLLTDGTANGPHTVSFIATDAAGNLSDPAVFTFTLAAPGPAVHISFPAEGQAFNHNPTFTGTVGSLSETNVTASVDGGTAQPVTVDAQGNFTFTPNVSGEGTHTVTFSADAPFTTVTRSFVLDTVAPAISITGPAAGQPFNSSPTITGKIAEATSGLAGAHASIDGGPDLVVTVDAQGNFSFVPPLATDGSADGPHVVKITAVDAAGNQAIPQSVTFTLDTVAPALAITSPSDGASLKTSPVFTGTASDANGVAGLTVSVDGGAAQTVTVDAQGNFTFNPGLATNGSADGPHQYVFKATDTAGNVTTKSETIYLDTTKPVAMITSPANNQTFNTNPTITGSATDNIGTGFVEVFVDGVDVGGMGFSTNGSFSYTTNFATDGSANGPHTVTFIAYDAAGNASDPVTIHFVLQAP